MEGVELIRTPSDHLLVGIEKEKYPDEIQTLMQILIRYGLPMPDGLVEDEPSHTKWGAVFTVHTRWWQSYIEDWTPCPEEWFIEGYLAQET